MVVSLTLHNASLRNPVKQNYTGCIKSNAYVCNFAGFCKRRLLSMSASIRDSEGGRFVAGDGPSSYFPGNRRITFPRKRAIALNDSPLWSINSILLRS